MEDVNISHDIPTNRIVCPRNGDDVNGRCKHFPRHPHGTWFSAGIKSIMMRPHQTGWIGQCPFCKSEGVFSGSPEPREEPEMNSSSEDRWFSVEEIASYLGIKRDTVYKWIDRKTMPAHKVGSLWKFRKEEIDDWVRSGEARDKRSEHGDND